MQYLNILSIPSKDNIVLGKELTSLVGPSNLSHSYRTYERTFYNGIFTRINLLLGGKHGTVASMVMGLALLGFIDKTRNTFINFRIKIAAIICFGGALLTLSISILTAFIMFVYWLLYYKYKKNNWTLVICSIIIIFFVSGKFLTLSDGSTPREYLEGTIITIGDLVNLKDWVLGSGPIITSKGFFHISDSYVRDVGIFSVMQESGIINMYFILAFIAITLHNGMLEIRKRPDKLRLACGILFTIGILSIHTNIILLPPFNVVFAFTAAGLLLPAQN
ncbi:MAG: hypothetical protein HQ521_02640 [Bacteroidetes bacterium]|nr:hypothetical protein [Bacteroidota bacterium]